MEFHVIPELQLQLARAVCAGDYCLVIGPVWVDDDKEWPMTGQFVDLAGEVRMIVRLDERELWVHKAVSRSHQKEDRLVRMQQLQAGGRGMASVINGFVDEADIPAGLCRLSLPTSLGRSLS